MKTEVNLQRDVLDELDWDPSVDAAQIGVTAKEGIVTLTGHVLHHSEKHAAAEVAKRVHGVRAVANEIEVRPGDSHQRDDADIAAAAVHSLEWDANVPHEHIQVTVEESWITLEGAVDQQFEKEAAERAIRNLVGAHGVTNAIRVEPRSARHLRPLEPDVLKAHIESALERSASLRTKRIVVEIDRDSVVLSGDVHSPAELDEAERIAWASRQVTRVENCLTITPWGHGPSEEWGY